MLNKPWSAPPESVKVGVSPLSGSVAVTVMTPVWFSAAFTLLLLVMLGESLIRLIVTVVADSTGW